MKDATGFTILFVLLGIYAYIMFTTCMNSPVNYGPPSTQKSAFSEPFSEPFDISNPETWTQPQNLANPSNPLSPLNQ